MPFLVIWVNVQAGCKVCMSELVELFESAACSPQHLFSACQWILLDSTGRLLFGEHAFDAMPLVPAFMSTT